MITQTQYDKISKIVGDYLNDPKQLKVSELRAFGESLTPTSPKSGKQVTFGTMCNYLRGKIPSHCNKFDLVYTLNSIAVYDGAHGYIKPEKQLGFFAA